MNKLRALLLGGLCAVLVGAGQPARAQVRARARVGQPGGRLSQLDNAKIAFITSRLTLSQEQAQRFWPLYNEQISKRRELNRTARLLRRNAGSPSLNEAQLRDNFNQDFALRQQQFDLEKEYFERMQKVITMRQLAQLYQAERDFTKEVLQRVDRQAPAAPPSAN